MVGAARFELELCGGVVRWELLSEPFRVAAGSGLSFLVPYKGAYMATVNSRLKPTLEKVSFWSINVLPIS